MNDKNKIKILELFIEDIMHNRSTKNEGDAILRRKDLFYIREIVGDITGKGKRYGRIHDIYITDIVNDEGIYKEELSKEILDHLKDNLFKRNKINEDDDIYLSTLNEIIIGLFRDEKLFKDLFTYSRNTYISYNYVKMYDVKAYNEIRRKILGQTTEEYKIIKPDNIDTRLNSFLNPRNKDEIITIRKIVEMLKSTGFNDAREVYNSLNDNRVYTSASVSDFNINPYNIDKIDYRFYHKYSYLKKDISRMIIYENMNSNNLTSFRELIDNSENDLTDEELEMFIATFMLFITNSSYNKSELEEVAEIVIEGLINKLDDEKENTIIDIVSGYNHTISLMEPILSRNGNPYIKSSKAKKVIREFSSNYNKEIAVKKNRYHNSNLDVDSLISLLNPNKNMTNEDVQEITSRLKYIKIVKQNYGINLNNMFFKSTSRWYFGYNRDLNDITPITISSMNDDNRDEYLNFLAELFKICYTKSEFDRLLLNENKEELVFHGKSEVKSSTTITFTDIINRLGDKLISRRYKRSVMENSLII